MLVLTRKPNESIIIGNDIVLTVLEVVGSKVRLGFQAPASVGIWRKELKEFQLDVRKTTPKEDARPDCFVEALV
jgi:carbon storage regulator